MSQKPLCECNQRIAVLENAYIRAGWREHDRRVELHAAKQKLTVLEALLREALEYWDDGVGRCDSEWVLLRKLRTALSASAEPRIKMVRAHKHTCANVQPGSTSADACDCGAMADGKPVEIEQGSPVERDERARCKHPNAVPRSQVADGKFLGYFCKDCDVLLGTDRAALDSKATEDCLHEFIPFTKGCSKCGEPYSTEGANHE